MTGGMKGTYEPFGSFYLHRDYKHKKDKKKKNKNCFLDFMQLVYATGTT